MNRRLAESASPYLRAHADNPVPWCVVEGRLGGSAITVAAINALASRSE